MGQAAQGFHHPNSVYTEPMESFDRSATAADVFNLLSPDAESTGSWMCAGMRDDGGTYSQTITWDGHALLAAIENTSRTHEPLKLYIQGVMGQEVGATLNGKDTTLEDALVLFCEESERMPAPVKLAKKRSPGVSR